MNQKSNIYTFLFLCTLLVGGLSIPSNAQQILNVTEIPHNAVESREPEDIRIMDGKVIVPIYRADNRIYQYLPHVEVDSFHTPKDIFNVLDRNVRTTFYAEYEPYVGFVDKDMVNYGEEKDLSIEGNYIAYARTTSPMGINNNILFPYPTTADTFPNSKSTIAVYDKIIDSFIFVNVFAEKRKYNLKSDIEGDYIYVNIPLTWEDAVLWGDLVFMGDTLTYQFGTWSRGSNYLSKINFKTGEKIWTRHIGYGDVHQIVVDDQHRINIEIETGAPAMYNMEWEDPDYNLDDYGSYDRLIYRMSAGGERLDHTYIKTHGVPAIYEVEFNRDGSFQAFGLVAYPMFINVEGDSLDFLDALSFEESKGLALVYDANLDYKWGKKIISEGRTLIQAMNKNPNGDYVISTVCEGRIITIDGDFFISPLQPSGQELLDQAILTRFDSEGQMLGVPVFSNHNIRIEDLQALGEHHYLLNVRKFDWYSYDFIDTSFIAKDVSYFIEYEGDIFNIMTSVEEYFDQNEIRVSPNPAIQGGNIHIELPEGWKGSTIIGLYKSNGEQVRTMMAEESSNNLFMIPNNINSGVYYLKIENQSFTKTISIYIH